MFIALVARFGEGRRGGRRMRETPTQVECANCSQQIEANRYILSPPQDWTLDSIHVVTVAAGFVGTVRCPHCLHFTIYRQPKDLSYQARVPS
jgi:ribosomal protein S27E